MNAGDGSTQGITGGVSRGRSIRQDGLTPCLAAIDSYLGNFRAAEKNGTIKTEAVMRRVIIFLAATVLCSVLSRGQQSSPAPQTARQALIEMFFSKTSGTFVKHLPAATRAALEKSGALGMLQQYSLMASQVSTQGQNVQTFESGSVMLAGEDPKTGQKFEMRVENDALRGDEDDIAVSFQIYKNGQAQRTPFMPQMTFSMKKEAQVWTLNEVSVTIHLPLADPDFLKALSEKVQPQSLAQSTFTPGGGTLQPQPVTHTTFTVNAEAPSQSAGSDSLVIAAMRTILTAEVTYATTYPTAGFACTLSSLDGFGGGEPNERQAMLISSGLASGKKYGFVFTLSECTGTPAKGFRLTAVPGANVYGRKVFCADQSNVIRSSDDGNPATCLASGTPIQ
jgi:type IV pilus assembly protein PilA